MRDVEFRNWLSQRLYKGKPLTTVGNRVGWVKAAERALPELGFSQTTLDAIFDDGQWDVALNSFSDLRANWKSNPDAARKIAPQSTDPHLQVSNTRQAVGLYGRFLRGDDPNFDDPEGDAVALTDEEIIGRFLKASAFQSWYASWSEENREAFLRIVRTTHEAGLDWYHVNQGQQVRCGRKEKGAIDATEVFAVVSKKVPDATVRQPADLSALQMEAKIGVGLSSFADKIDQMPEVLNRFGGREGLWPDEVKPEVVKPDAEDDGEMTNLPAPTNLILYGPPGTGKTFNTAREAVKLCDNLSRKELDLRYPETPEGRRLLRARYDELRTQERIGFVTFHQSYSYEDFVEGLRPVPLERDDGPSSGFELKPHEGIFKRMARLASNGIADHDQNEFVLGDRRVFKMSLGYTGNREDDYVFEDAIEHGYVRLGYDPLDYSAEKYRKSEEIAAACLQRDKENPDPNRTPPSNHSGRVQCPMIFRNWMQIGDLVVISKGNSNFRAIGEITGDYEYDDSVRSYTHRRRVRWLYKCSEGEPASEIYGKNFTMQSIYELYPKHLKPAAIERYINSEAGPKRTWAAPFVLVIDEINRANISKVFGELITLIEPDKRLGMDEELTVRLPYSPEDFGVPANLHIIGTMNTADRSIALLDTALRRRFSFREMEPKADFLAEASRRTGIDLVCVLTKINERLEYLIGREHRIGHAFFIGCETTDAVKEVMRDKVIPLLQEYFFEDWSRIRAVLGDGFITESKLDAPPGVDGDKVSTWSVPWPFEDCAFDRLVGKVAPAEEEGAANGPDRI